MIEEYVFDQYKTIVQQTGRARYAERQAVYILLAMHKSDQYVIQNIVHIKNRLDQIERETTGRDCGNDWRTRE